VIPAASKCTLPLGGIGKDFGRRMWIHLPQRGSGELDHGALSSDRAK
jgi:hypothetical protein